MDTPRKLLLCFEKFNINQIITTTSDEIDEFIGSLEKEMQEKDEIKESVSELIDNFKKLPKSELAKYNNSLPSSNSMEIGVSE